MSSFEQLVLYLLGRLQFLLLLLLLFLLLRLHHLAVLAQEPLLSRYLHLRALLHLHLLHLVLEVELLLPGQEVLGRDGREGCELGPLEDFYGFCDDGLFFLGGLAVDEVLVYPVPGFLDNIEDDGFVVTVDDDIIDFLGDVVDVVAGDAGDGLDLVLDGRERVLLGVLEHDADLVLEGVAFVGLAQHCELVGRGLFEHLELVEVDVRQGCELIVLMSQVLHFSHPISLK